MRYYKNIANLLLWELWECLAITIKIIASISSSRCYILKNPAIWLADIISLHNSKTRIFPDMGLVKKNNNKISFHFRLFPRKTNDKIFQKIKKTLFCGHFGLAKMNFPAKKRLSQFLNISIIYHRTKNQKKLLSHSWEKCQTDTRTENGDFTGPSVGRGSKKPNYPRLLEFICRRKIFFGKLAVIFELYFTEWL